MTKAVGRRNWAEALDRGRPAAGLPTLLGAAAVGGAIVYFMDPVKGSERRHSTLDAGRHAFKEMANAVKHPRGRAGDQAADDIERARSRVS